ncbi:MAG: isocitrate lyase/PEP mutase family protein [Cypionkella sp.]
MTIDWLHGNTRRVNGDNLRELIASGRAVATAGAYDGMTARLAQRAGFEVLYLSGAALSASLALPDLGLLTLEDVRYAAQNVVRASNLPLIVDCDTGFGEALNVMRTVREMEGVGAACIQIEDQQFPKKCGHLSGKRLVSEDDMCRKLDAALRASDKMLICARTDAAAVSLDEAIQRAKRYAEVGAQLIFVEALRDDESIRRVRAEIGAPLLANMTEFGQTPQIPLSQWHAYGYEIVIYPVSAFRVTSAAAEAFYVALRADGDVTRFLPQMMTRTELYEVIGYHDYETLDSSVARSTLPDPSARTAGEVE